MTGNREINEMAFSEMLASVWKHDFSDRAVVCRKIVEAYLKALPTTPIESELVAMLEGAKTKLPYGRATGDNTYLIQQVGINDGLDKAIAIVYQHFQVNEASNGR